MIVEALRIFVILAVGSITALTLREITEDMQHHWSTRNRRKVALDAAAAFLTALGACILIGSMLGPLSFT